MSYDLMVFDASAAPSDRDTFTQWFDALTEWGEGHSYDDSAVTSEPLRQWYRAMLVAFPAMNGPDADPSQSDDDPHVTDYSIAKQAIYCAFAWSVAEEAFNLVSRLAREHGVGFFDVSGDNGDILFPDGTSL